MRSFLGRRKYPASVPVTIQCLCGETIDGLRQAESQVLTCPSCGESVFVLPQSPLPEPKLASKAGRREPAARPRPIKPKRATPDVDSASSQPAGRPVVPEVEVPEPAARRPFWTKPRLVFAAAALVVGLSVWWQWRRAELTSLAERMQPEALRALQAVEEGRLDEARTGLAVTVEAMDRLGEHPAEEARYRQLFAELEVVAALAPGPIEDLLAGGLEFPERVSKQILGMAIILDAVVEPAETGGYRVDYSLFVDEERVTLNANDFELFQRLALREKTRIIFGARLAGVARTTDGQWQIQLLPRSGVLITERAIYERLGLERDPDSAALRERQRTLVADGGSFAQGAEASARAR